MNSSVLLISTVVSMSLFATLLAVRTWNARNKPSTLSAAFGGGPTADMRQLEMSRPATERILRPFLRRFYVLGRRFTPSGSIEQLQHSLIVAGIPGGMTVTDFLGLRFIVGALTALVVFILFFRQQPTSMVLLYAFVGFVIGMYIPNYWLKSKVKARQKAVQHALPDALDMMSICVDAGLGFEAAIQKVAFQSKDELAIEFRRIISEIRVGVPRTDALRHLAERVDVADVSSFVGVLIQADQLGIAIRDVLATQSDQMRVNRRQRAQEAAAKAPIKMMIPMVIFIFPALFIVILGPAVPGIMGMFG